MPPAIFDIPEIKGSVAAYLSNHDLTMAIRVNKQWFEWFVQPLWKRIVEFSFRPSAPPKPSDTGFKEGLAKYGHHSLQSLTISTEHRLEAYLAHCQHLLDLRIFFPYDLKQPGSPEMLNRLILLNPSLESLAITAPLFVIEHAYFEHLSSLTTLYLNRTFINLQELVQILSYAPHLTTLGFREVIFGPRLMYREDIDEAAFSAQLSTQLTHSTAMDPACLPWQDYPRLRDLSFWTPMEALDIWIFCRLLEHAPNLLSISFSLSEEQGLFPALCTSLQQYAHHLQQLTITASYPFGDDPAAAAMVTACRNKPLEIINIHDYVNASRLPVQIQLDIFATTLREVRLFNFEEVSSSWFPRLVQACHLLEVLDLRFPFSMVQFSDVALATWNCRRLRKLDLVIGMQTSSSSVREMGQSDKEEGSLSSKDTEEDNEHHHHPSPPPPPPLPLSIHGRHIGGSGVTLGVQDDLGMLERIFFEKLAGLTQLQQLTLKGPRGYKGQDTDRHLDMTLESGLSLLKDLRQMREFRVVSMNHFIGTKERGWMRVHWPLLRVCEICPSGIRATTL